MKKTKKPEWFDDWVKAINSPAGRVLLEVANKVSVCSEQSKEAKE